MKRSAVRSLAGRVRRVARVAQREWAGRSAPDVAVRAAPATASTLAEIGSRTGTSPAWQDDLDDYDRVLTPLRSRRIHLLQIGVQQAAALRMWEEYFPRASLVGVDSAATAQQFATDRVAIVVGDPSKRSFLVKLAGGRRPHVVLDDGSPDSRRQVETLQVLFPMLRPGGCYILHDLRAYDFVAQLARVVAAGDRGAAPTDPFLAYARQTLGSVEFIRGSAVLRKRSFAQGRYKLRSVADVTDAVRTDIGGSYQRIPAELVGAGDDVRAGFATMTADPTVRLEPAASGEVADAQVLYSGVVVVGTAVLDETLNCSRNVRRDSGLFQAVPGRIWVDERPAEPVETIAAIEGRRHVLLKQVWDANYGHWLIDTLPKVGLLRTFADLDECVFVLNSPTKPGMQQVVEDSLGLFGIRPDQLLHLDRRRRYAFDRLTVLGTLTRHPVSKSPFAIETLEALAEQVAPRGGPRLYVARGTTGRRELHNEDAVIAVLAEYGYQVIVPQEHRLVDQIATFRAARHVVGVMGASLANLAFSPRGVSVLALSTPAMHHDYFYDIVCLKQGRYRGLQGTSEHDVRDLGTHFSVDLDQLREQLAWLHADDATPPGD